MKMNISANSMRILEKRYLLKDESDKVIETPEEMIQRVADVVCKDNEVLKAKIIKMMIDLRFLPNTPTLMNAGGSNMLSACFGIKVDDNLESIMHDAVWQQAKIHKMGGGVGINFSSLRPKGDLIKSTGGVTSGVIGFLHVFNTTSEIIRQGGKRDGANMGILNVDHPEIFDWIKAKSNNNKAEFRNFNLSVGVSNIFMKAVESDDVWDLKFNDVVYKRVKARYLFSELCKSAWETGCPGIIFLDEINECGYLSEIGMMIDTTNPCVTSDMWITTTEGAKQVKDLIGVKFNAVVNGQTKDLFSCPFVSDGFFSTGKKDVYKIETFEGYESKLTLEHPVLTLDSRISNYESKNKLITKWKKVKDLKMGDEILLNNHLYMNKWEGKYTEREGYLIGLLLGDGHIPSDKSPVLATWGEFDGVKNIRWCVDNYAKSYNNKSNFKRWYHLKKENENDTNRLYLMNCSFIKETCTMLGIRHGNKVLTPQIEKTSFDFYKGFIKGFFDADGTVIVNHKKGSSIRLSQSNYHTLQSIQRMLLRIGIYSTVYKDRNTSSTKMLPDGKGGYKEYNIKTQYELVISNDCIGIYYNKIGFNDTDKMNKVKNVLNGYKRTPNEQKFTAKITKINKVGIEEVYDAKVEEVHIFDGNGMMLHNCGELPVYVGDYKGELVAESCNLGSLNLSKYVKSVRDETINLLHNVILGNADSENIFDFSTFEKDIYTAVEFLDMVIDANNYPFSFIEKGTKLTRKIGLGVTGFTECLIKLGYSYDSDEAVKFTDLLFSKLEYYSHKASKKIGKSKGLFELADDLAIDRRNLTTNAIAPTGSIGRFMDVGPYSSGIEPLPAIYMKSHIIDSEVDDGIYSLFTEMLKSYGEINIDFKDIIPVIIKKVQVDGSSIQNIEELPDFMKKLFLVAEEIPIKRHIEIQSIVQKHIDSAVSKTVNIKHESNVSDIHDAFILAWKNKCKGVTIYRNGSKENQVFEIKKTEADKVADNQINKNIECNIDNVTDLVPRPKILPALSFIMRTGCSTLFISPTFNNGKNGALELFMNKSSERGGCLGLQDGIAITISVYQRYLEAISHEHAVNALRIVTGHLLKKTCRSSELAIERQKVSNKNIDNLVNCLSCPNAIGQCLSYMLEHNISFTENGVINMSVVNNEDVKIDKTEDILVNNENDYSKCPDCGNRTIRQEGCMNDVCVSCGWGGCN